MTFQELQDRIAERLGIPGSATASLARIGRSINDVYREVTTTIGLDLSRRVPGVTGATALGSRTVTFSNLEKLERVYDDTSGSVRVLDEISYDQMQNINPATSDNARRWAVESWTASSVTVRLDILAQTVFNLKADGLSTATTLDNDDIPAFPVSFHDILIDGVLADEYLKLEKQGLSDRAMARFEKRLSDLRMWRAKSIAQKIRQNDFDTHRTTAGVGGGGGGSAPSGGTSYEQTGLITFNRDPDAPFAVSSGSAVVPNLIAESASNIDSVTTDRLIGRDTTGTGDSEQLTVGGGIEFTGSGGIQTSAFTGDVTKSAGGVALTIADDAVTYAKMQNSSASRLIGRGSASGGSPEELIPGDGIVISGSTVSTSWSAAWTTVAHSSANFTANGSMTWTVESADQVTFAYVKSGRTMTVAFTINSTSVGGTPNTSLLITIPGSFTALRTMHGTMNYSDNGTAGVGFCVVSASGTTIQCFKIDTSNWTASTNATNVRGQITFETTT